MKNKNALFLVQGAVIAALYTALTFLCNALGLASGVIQVRFSEALCVLPMFTPAAVPGLFIGCALSNLLTGCAPWDVVFGSLATLLGALGTRRLRKSRYLAVLPPIIANTLIVPWVLSRVYRFEGSIFYFMATVCAGEVISCGVLGLMLYAVLKKNENRLF